MQAEDHPTQISQHIPSWITSTQIQARFYQAQRQFNDVRRYYQHCEIDSSVQVIHPEGGDPTSVRTIIGFLEESWARMHKIVKFIKTPDPSTTPSTSNSKSHGKKKPSNPSTKQLLNVLDKYFEAFRDSIIAITYDLINLRKYYTPETDSRLCETLIHHYADIEGRVVNAQYYISQLRVASAPTASPRKKPKRPNSKGEPEDTGDETRTRYKP